MTETVKRPTTARKTTRKVTEKRDSMLDEGLRLTIEGEDYTIRAGDLNALDARELRKQVGMTFVELIQGFGTHPDIDLVAAVVWLARRIKGDRTLTYDAVAEAMGYDVFDTIEFAEAGPDEDAATDPEG